MLDLFSVVLYDFCAVPPYTINSVNAERIEDKNFLYTSLVELVEESDEHGGGDDGHHDGFDCNEDLEGRHGFRVADSVLCRDGVPAGVAARGEAEQDVHGRDAQAGAVSAVFAGSGVCGVREAVEVALDDAGVLQGHGYEGILRCSAQRHGEGPHAADAGLWYSSAGTGRDGTAAGAEEEADEEEADPHGLKTADSVP